MAVVASRKNSGVTDYRMSPPPASCVIHDSDLDLTRSVMVELEELPSNSNIPAQHDYAPSSLREHSRRRGPASEGERRTSDTLDIPEGHHLLPADGGLAAWRVLLGAFVVEALLWGFPMSYGVFQNYYFEHEPFRGNKNIPLVGTVATGIGYLGAPIIVPLIKRYHKYQRHMIWIGWPICVLSLIAGSFAKDVPTLIATQGLMYGTGQLILYYPILSMVNEWFIKKRGLAYGILSCATGVTGVAVPFVEEVLLKNYGYPTALRATAIAFIVITGPFLLFFKGRLPVMTPNTVQRTDWSFLRNPLFYIYSASNICHGLGWFFPALFLPSYATSIGLTPTSGALLLALICVAQVIGQLVFGYLSDRKIPLHFLIFLSPFISAISTFTLWGLAQSLPPLVVFSLIYGSFGAGYVVLWARMGTSLSEEPTAALATFSVFAFEKGVGNVLTGPISSALISQTTSSGSYGVTRYKGIVIFTGACMLLSSLNVGAWYLKPGVRRVRLFSRT